MAAIYLGLNGSEQLLPPVRWVNGGDPHIPIDYSKQIDKATMLDGSTRFNFRSHHPRRWTLGWEAIDSAELVDLLALNAINGELRFQNQWEDTSWRCVVITSFTYDVNVRLSCKAPLFNTRYTVSITLEEVV